MALTEDPVREESQRFVQAVLAFIGSDIDGKDVLEVGCGRHARLTEHLVIRAGRLTCIDSDEDAIQQNRVVLGNEAASRVEYQCVSIQDYTPTSSHDLVICAHVLIHQHTESALAAAAESISCCADVVFIFELTDVLDPRLRSVTQIRNAEALLATFNMYQLMRQGKHTYFQEEMTFLKLTR